MRWPPTNGRNDDGRSDDRRRPHQGVRPDASPRRARPDRPHRRGARVPRAERRRQDHHDPRPAGADAGRRRPRHAARRQPLDRRHRAAPAARVRAGRRHPLAQPHRWRGHRPARPAARRARQDAARGTRRALRPRPAQEGPDVLEGQPAEGRPRRGTGVRCGAAGARRADVRARPADGRGVPAGRRGGAGTRRPDRAAVLAHPVRGRGALRPRHDHPGRAHRRVGHPGRAAAPGADHHRRLARARAGRLGGAARGARPEHVRLARPPVRRPVFAGRPDAAPRRSRAEEPGEPAADARRAVPAPLPPRRAGRSGAMTGTWALLRLVLRRDRLLVPVWIVWLAVAPMGYLSSIEAAYPDAVSRQHFYDLNASSATFVVRNGPLYGSSVGNLLAWRCGCVPVAVGLIALLPVTRHTGTEEEAGRRELTGATVVGRHAGLAAAVIAACGACAVYGLLVGFAVAAQGVPAAGAFALGGGFALSGWVFAGVGAVAAQLTWGAGGARGIGIGVLVLAFLLRAVGDSGTSAGWVAWLSPIGWAHRMRPFAGEQWWVLALAVVVTGSLVVSGV